MSVRRAYLDHNATSPLRAEARAAMLAALELDGNASSVHAEGRRARATIDKARADVAALVGCSADDVVFTSGATEANNWVLHGPWEHVAVGAIEHVSVLEPARAASAAVRRLAVDDQGRIQAAALTQWTQDVDTGAALICIQAANNETGVVQDVAALAAARGRALVHTDAVQFIGRLPVTAQLSAHCDFISISAHKIGGPKGVGALIARVGLVERLRPLIRGGGQERRLRAGTENVAAVAGFGAACAALHREGSTERERVRRLRDRLEDALREITPGAVVVGARADRLPNTTCVALPGRRSDTLVIGLDLEGVAVSAGAACSSGRIERSHVLAAMGLADDIAASAVRISLGWSTSEADIEQFIGAWRRVAGHRPVRAAVA